MEKIIFRKFLYDLISFFLIVSLSLSLIAWVIQSVNYLDFISKDGHGFKVYFAIIALNFPKIFSKVIIFSYFISLFYVIQKYQINNEILIFWTNGISRLKLTNFIIKTSIIFTIIQIVFVYSIVPKTQDYSREFIRTSNMDLFTSLITEKKFIDTLKDFTLFVENIDEEGNMKNIFLKDSLDKVNTQIVTARSGKIIEDGSKKFLSLNFGQILDITNNKPNESKIIKFNSTNFNISNFKTKSTIFPKFQELNSSILISCVNNFLFGNKENYFLPIFSCSKESSIKSAKEIFNRSIKQLYLIVVGIMASILIFSNDRKPKFIMNKIIIFSIGILCIIISEVNSELINLSLQSNILFISLPFIIFFMGYIAILNLNNKRF